MYIRADLCLVTVLKQMQKQTADVKATNKTKGIDLESYIFVFLITAMTFFKAMRLVIILLLPSVHVWQRCAEKQLSCQYHLSGWTRPLLQLQECRPGQLEFLNHV